jgi:hypothetical protein
MTRTRTVLTNELMDALIVRYGALTWRAIRGRPPDIQIGSGSAL